MAVKFVAVKCPECGANLQIEDGRKSIFCSYCGTKIMITNDNEYVCHHIDEAEIKRAETDQIIRLRELQMEEERFQREQEEYRDAKQKKREYEFKEGMKKFISTWLKCLLVLFALGALIDEFFWDLMLWVIIGGVGWIIYSCSTHSNNIYLLMCRLTSRNSKNDQ